MTGKRRCQSEGYDQEITLSLEAPEAVPAREPREHRRRCGRLSSLRPRGASGGARGAGAGQRPANGPKGARSARATPEGRERHARTCRSYRAPPAVNGFAVLRFATALRVTAGASALVTGQDPARCRGTEGD